MPLGRVQTAQQDGVTVQVAIPTEDEAAQHFGVPLAERGLQPIWLSITNASDVDFWLLPIAIDPDYYSADEAALVTGVKLTAEQKAAATRRFREEALPFFLRAGSTNAGFARTTIPCAEQIPAISATASLR